MDALRPLLNVRRGADL
ncbi:hypothetical protein PLA107_006140 [Pseudomonas amygdali pv. lachrymans str. M301315]|uniref:Uncharacterized protein n=1 Tax=Pseudomonas amygdali pv. lachrymans str. M301315 TaxID=629260 RepID=A0AAD0M4R3_PSEAV|nr:hypothetical protein PLA107_006140 [Pseudomonas amygdali pv. lachrymans str. M301315]PWD00172.1 hypothetical protein CX658_24600 [Pseudomonas amygdali pv. lachrymans]